MNFDQLLRKYITGTLSEAELERFRDLLERRPEYKVELRQTLELRSLIQDDALNLTPPDDFSDRVRAAVGARFAAENPVRKQREEERRRGVIFPFRIAAGALATTFIALMVILGPSIIEPFGDIDVSHGKGSQVVAAHQLLGGSGNKSAANASRSTDQSSLALSLPATTTSTRAVHRGVNSVAPLTKEQPSTVRSSGNVTVASLPSTSIPVGSVVASLDVSEAVQQSVVLRKQDSTQSSDIGALALLPRIASGALTAIYYNPALDSVSSRGVESLAMVAQTGNELDGIGPRRLTLGMTLGSGRVTASDAAPTPLLQNSYYFSFSVSSNDRIGLEMGSSTFRQDRSLSSFSSTGGFTKGSSGGSSHLNSASAGDNSRESSNPVSSGQVKVVEQRLAQQITYGAVFYDRRVEVSHSWDLCGRMTVGAADNALISNLRAYAAFSPSKNVTLTLGIGGSGLYNLNSKGQVGSGNYGIYYGIETGF